MLEKRISVPLGIFLFFGIFLLSLLPLIVLRSFVYPVLRRNLENNAVQLSLSTLDQARRYFEVMIEEGEKVLNFTIEEAVLQEETGGSSLLSLTTHLQSISNYTSFLETFYLVDPQNEKALYFSKNEKDSPIKEIDITSFLISEKYKTINRNKSNFLLLGSSPEDKEDTQGIWGYGFIETKNKPYVIIVQYDSEEVTRFFNSINIFPAALLHVILPDNYIFQTEEASFFDQPYAPQALSRTIQGRFIDFKSIKKRGGHIEPVLCQVYSDPRFFYNFVAVLPQEDLMQTTNRVLTTTMIGLLILAGVLNTLGIILTMKINQKFESIFQVISRISSGNFETRFPNKASVITEFNRLRNIINGMAEHLHNTVTSLKESQDALENAINKKTDQLKQSEEILKRTEDTLIQSEKMADLGRLVANLTHEINNSISVGLTAATHLSSECKSIEYKYKDNKLTNNDFENFVKTTNEAGSIIFTNLHNTIEITNNFKHIAKDQTLGTKRVIDLDLYMKEIINSLSPRLKKKPYSIDYKGQENLKMLVNPSYFYQILSNLVNNSLIHGFSGRTKGKISIELQLDSENVILCYKDDGNGIPTDILPHIHEQFFTTKPLEEGTGIGMYVIHNLVTDKLHGSALYSSDTNKGVDFKFTFPLTQPERD